MIFIIFLWSQAFCIVKPNGTKIHNQFNLIMGDIPNKANFNKHNNAVIFDLI